MGRMRFAEAGFSNIAEDEQPDASSRFLRVLHFGDIAFHLIDADPHLSS